MPLSAVNGNGVSTRYQSRRKLFRESLESAVVRRNPTRAEKRNPHLLARSYPRAALERASEREDAFALAGLLTGV